MRETAAFFRAAPRWWQVVCILALLWGFLRFGVQIYTFLSPMSDQVGVDLKSAYLEAARRFAARQELYPASIEAMEGLYFYAPPVALFFIPLTWIPEQVAMFLWLGLGLAAYVGLFCAWRRIFDFLQLERARRALFFSLPLWIVFSPFWDDVTYLNIYTLMALAGSLLIEAVLRERLALASVCLAGILATKPQWSFVVLLPLLFGHYRFFWKWLAGALASYLLLAALGALASNPAYLGEQYREYLGFLARISRQHPWRTVADGFLGYNHSILQIAIFLGGKKVWGIGQLVKYLLLLPACGLVLRGCFLGRLKQVDQRSEIGLAWAFLLYLAAFLWLDLLWELYLTIAIFPYLLSLNLARWKKVLVWVVFLPYALLDLWRVGVYAAGSPFIQEAYLAWDFSAYLPVIMVVLLVFYGLLLQQLWFVFRRSP